MEKEYALLISTIQENLDCKDVKIQEVKKGIVWFLACSGST